MENASRSRGLDPSKEVFNMARKVDIKAIDNIVKDVGLTREQRRLLHDQITGQGYSLQEIREIAEEVKRLFPNK